MPPPFSNVDLLITHDILQPPATLTASHDAPLNFVAPTAAADCLPRRPVPIDWAADKRRVAAELADSLARCTSDWERSNVLNPGRGRQMDERRRKQRLRWDYQAAMRHWTRIGYWQAADARYNNGSPSAAARDKAEAEEEEAATAAACAQNKPAQEKQESS